MALRPSVLFSLIYLIHFTVNGQQQQRLNQLSETQQARLPAQQTLDHHFDDQLALADEDNTFISRKTQRPNPAPFQPTKTKQEPQRPIDSEYQRPIKQRPSKGGQGESEIQIDAAGQKTDGGHEKGMPFDFSYNTVDDETKNHHSHTAQGDGDVVVGEYKTLMADGRTQVVKYTADWKNGYRVTSLKYI